MDITEQQRQELPQKAVDFLFHAEDAYKQNDYWSALAYSDSVEQYNPDLTDLNFLRGKIYSDWNRPAMAESSYTDVIEIDPNYPGVFLNRGNVQLLQKKFREALESYEHALENYPSTNVYFQIGRAYTELGVTDSAATAYEQAIQMDSTNASAYMWLGQLYEDDGENETALQYTKKGWELNPDNLNYQFLLALQLIKTNQLEEAIPYLKRVAEARPWHVGSHYNLGQTLVRLGEEVEGQRYLDIADSLQQEEDNLDDLINLADMQPDNIERWLALGDAYRESHRFDEAKQAYQVALGYAPWNLAVRANVATLNMVMGDTLGAISEYRTILQIDPSYADVWLNLGVAYANIGRIDYARECWNNALMYDEDHEMARQYLAETDSME